MKNNLIKFVAMFLSVVLLFSLAACRKSKDNNDTPKANNNQEVENGDLSGLDEPGSSDDLDVVLSRPVTDGSISTGVKLGEYSQNESVDEFETNIDNELEYEDLEEIDEIIIQTTYKPLIQKYGNKTNSQSNIRKIFVDNSKGGVVFKGFQGIGCNVFPTQSILESQIFSSKKYGGDDSEAYLELEAKRFNDISGCYARSWFQIDWIITNYAGDDYLKYEKDWEKNPDYVTYYNGQYDFNSEIMQSCVDYWRILKEAGTNIEVAFGWKIADRIQYWFGAEPSRPRIAAPRDVKQYAKAAKALFLYCYSVGLDNVNVLGFYNEPDKAEDATYRGSWDFVSIGEKQLHWASMARAARNELKKDSRTKNIEIWGAEDSSRIDVAGTKYINYYLNDKEPELLDKFTFHGYYVTKYGGEYGKNKNPYDDFFDACVFAYNHYKHPLVSSEYFAADRGVTDSQAKSYGWDISGKWNASTASYIIALANTGWKAALKWAFVGGYLPNPINGNPANDDLSSWIDPMNKKTAEQVHWYYYEETLINNYIPKNANVHKIDWEGLDVRVSAFTSKSGDDFALLVEKEENAGRLKFDINLKKALNKNIYVYKFTYAQECNAQATIPSNCSVITNARKRFAYMETEKDGADYAFYIFSTIKPLKQVEVYKTNGDSAVVVDASLSAGGEVGLNALLIDCNSSDTVSWNIKRYSVVAEGKGTKNEKKRVDKFDVGGSDKGTITQQGNNAIYKAAADAKVGDTIALRCTINGTAGDRFATVIVNIVE